MYATKDFLIHTLNTPMQLVFGRDAVLNTKFEADWKYIVKRSKRETSDKIIKENAKTDRPL
jgi:hypothetical protein